MSWDIFAEEIPDVLLSDDPTQTVPQQHPPLRDLMSASNHQDQPPLRDLMSASNHQDYEDDTFDNGNHNSTKSSITTPPNPCPVNVLTPYQIFCRQLKELKHKKIKFPLCSEFYIAMYHDHDEWFIEFENLLRENFIKPKYWFTVLVSRMRSDAVSDMYSMAPVHLIGNYKQMRDWICSTFGPRAPYYDIETELRALPEVKFENSVELFKEVNKLRCKYTRLCNRENRLPNTLDSQLLIAVLLNCLPSDNEIQREKLLELLTARVSYTEYRIEIESFVETSFVSTNKKKCFFCNQSGHLKKECPVRQFHQSKGLILIKEDDIKQTVNKYRHHYFFNNNNSFKGRNKFRPKGLVRLFVQSNFKSNRRGWNNNRNNNNRGRKFGNSIRSYVGDTGIPIEGENDIEEDSNEEDIDEGKDYINFDEIMIDEAGNTYSIEQIDGVEFMPVS